MSYCVTCYTYFSIVFDYVRGSHPTGNLQELADAANSSSCPMRSWAMTVKCPCQWVPAKLRNQQGLGAQASFIKPTQHCRTTCQHQIYERNHSIASRRKLSLLAHGPNPCHFLLYYLHYVNIISYYTYYFKNKKMRFIWNPVHLDRIGQIGTYWYVPVRTSTTRYKAVREFHGHTYWYVLVHTSTYFQEDKLFSDSSRKSQETRR